MNQQRGRRPVVWPVDAWQVPVTSEDEVTSINRIILNDAIETSERPVSISAFIREIVRKEIDLRADSIKEWNKDNIKKLKSK